MYEVEPSHTGISLCTFYLLNKDDRLPECKEQAAPAAPRQLGSCETPRHLTVQQGQKLTSHPMRSLGLRVTPGMPHTTNVVLTGGVSPGLSERGAVCTEPAAGHPLVPALAGADTAAQSTRGATAAAWTHGTGGFTSFPGVRLCPPPQMPEGTSACNSLSSIPGFSYGGSTGQRR